MSNLKIDFQMLPHVIPSLIHDGITYGTRPRPNFSKSFASFVRVAFRSFLQTTRPQRHGAGGLQKRLQAKAKTEDSKTAARGGSVGIREEGKNGKLHG